MITYTTDGNARYRVGTTQLTLATGDLFLVHRDAPLEHSVPGPSAWAYHYVCFDLDSAWTPPAPFVRQATGVYRARAGLIQTRQRIDDAFRRLLADVRSRDAADALARLRKRGEPKGERGAAEAHRDLALTAITEILLLVRGDALETARLDPRIVAALQVITADLATHHGASTLADTAGLSESRFLHLFRAQLGVPLRRAIRTLRLQQAASLLAYGSDPVGAIADEIGFSSIFALSREFRRAYGVSPRAYRAQSRTLRIPRKPLTRPAPG
jgi:AraC family transcriptional regulator of arabinose operon